MSVTLLQPSPGLDFEVCAYISLITVLHMYIWCQNNYFNVNNEKPTALIENEYHDTELKSFLTYLIKQVIMTKTT